MLTCSRSEATHGGKTEIGPGSPMPPRRVRGAKTVRRWVKGVAVDLDANFGQRRRDTSTKTQHLAELERDRATFDKAHAQQLEKNKIIQSMARSNLHHIQERRQKLMTELARAYGLLDDREDQDFRDDILPDAELEQLKDRREILQDELELLPSAELTRMQQNLGLDRIIREEAEHEMAEHFGHACSSTGFWTGLFGFGLIHCVVS